MNTHSRGTQDVIAAKYEHENLLPFLPFGVDWSRTPQLRGEMMEGPQPPAKQEGSCRHLALGSHCRTR